ncbi:spore cortex biosynthesis protein YabQ [uncultured Clostridium sp.]|jgi:spore cortex biosynthesis protein YabQ|uniref:spore cortex biosynthesis protein YabQ n=1 Tax=uncultured Clostridium sp. TaxID=59620 RepID=UPI002632DAB4|nr:spore cortex biosynthesis protein YabQ [uncultured Clostridium sp.]
MILPLGVQFNIVIISFFAGILIGLLFDGYRLVRGFNSSKIILMIQDTLFWILTAMIVFVFLLVFNYGFLSAYVYIIISIGLAFYLLVFSKRIFKLENTIARNTYRVIRISSKNIRYILKNIFAKK